MEFNEYQIMTKNTDLESEGRKKLKPDWMYYVLGMAGEMGEFEEKIKKLYRDHNGELTFEIKKGLGLELGDVLWYMARFCDKCLGIPFDDIPTLNIQKLASRKERSKLQGEGDNR